MADRLDLDQRTTSGPAGRQDPHRQAEDMTAPTIKRDWFNMHEAAPLALVFCPGNSLTKSRELLEDGVSGSGPHEGV